MKKKQFLFLITLLNAFSLCTIHAQAPYSGTIFIDPKIITAADPTTFVSSTYTGQGLRIVYDRRVSAFITLNTYLFNIVWSDGITSEAQINPEFGSVAAATVEATKYGTIIGRLPTCLRVDVDAIWIHKGVNPFGGGNKSILIHTGQSTLYETDGILEETLVHEASHTSLDAGHAAASGWVNAQKSDVKFISTYAADNSTREDIAESFLTWLAVRQATIRISQQNFNTISQTIPNRIKYFDNQSFNMFPLRMANTVAIKPLIFEEKIHIIPNPSSDFIILKGISNTVSIDIINALGQNVGSKTNCYDGSQIDISHLPKGLYYLHILKEGSFNRQTSKFFKRE